MSPNVALLLWVVLLFLLLRYDPGRESAISWAMVATLLVLFQPNSTALTVARQDDG